MKDEKSVGWRFHTNMPSFTGGSGVLIVILMLICLWFLYSDLLLPSTNTVDHVSSVYDTVNKIQADPTEYNTVNNIHANPNPTASSVLCDLSRGEWIPDTSPPLYTNETCRYINPSRDCLQNGRPDRGYLYWRWKPSDCDLPHFNASHFLELLRGKKIAFIGDSVARDHADALLCALTQVEDPEKDDPRWLFRSFNFTSYNFTLASFWSPYLVNHSLEQDGLAQLHLDLPEAVWASHLQEYDIAIISIGYWYLRKSLYRSNNTVLGASSNAGLNFTTIDALSAYRMALGTILKYMATEYRGVTMLRTVTVDHFEHGAWDTGGFCNRTDPFSSSHELHSTTVVPWINYEMKNVQIEEFEKAMALIAMYNGSSKLKILNVTYSASLRPDGHPGIYRNRQPDEPSNDCLHWCLPGPVDMWNQLVLHSLQPIFTRLPMV